MIYLMTEIIFTSEFKKEFKRLSKKFASLDQDMKDLIQELNTNPSLGKSLGNNVFKIRLGIKSKGKGKSGGARIISYFFMSKSELYLLSIYDKSEQQSISIKDIRSLIDSILQ